LPRRHGYLLLLLLQALHHRPPLRLRARGTGAFLPHVRKTHAPLAAGPAGPDAGAALRGVAGGFRTPGAAAGDAPGAALGRSLPALPRIRPRGAHREPGSGAPADLQGFGAEVETVSKTFSAA